MSPIYQTSSTKVQPVQPQVLNSVPANQVAVAKESKQQQPAGAEQLAVGGDRAGSPTTVGKPALPPKPPPPPLGKTSTPPPPPRQSAAAAYHLPQYHQPDTSSDDGGGGRAYYTDCRPAQQKDLTPPPRIPNGNGPVKSHGFGDSSESDNSSSSASMRSVFGNAAAK